MKPARLFLAAVVLLVATASFGQQSFMDEPGIPAFTTSFPVEHGFINLANGNLHIEIPIASYPQRGNISALHARLVYDSRFWTVRSDPVTSAQSWVPSVSPTGISVGGAFRLITDGEPGKADSDRGVATQCACISIINGLCQPRFKITYSNYFYQEPNGTFHRLANNFKLINKDDSCPGAASTPDGTAYPIDGSGYKFVITNYTNMTVYAPDGAQVFPALQDTNGNFYSNSAGQNSTFTNVVDTLGRIPVVTTFSGSQVFLDYLCLQGCNSANGDRARVTINTSTPAWATQFNQTAGGTVTEYSGPGSAIQSIVFPDGSSYQFQVDSYGQITSMTLPTGGQITYGYANFTDFQGKVNRWVASMIRDGQTWSFTPLNQACSAPPCPMQVTVTTPPYNDGTTTIADNHLYLFSATSSAAWNTQTQYFRGAVSGTPVLTKTTDYGVAGACPATPGIGLTSLVIRNTLTWPSGSGTLSKKAEYCYDSYANVTTTKEWDYQPNGNFAAAPDREVDTTYVTDPAYVSANIIKLPLVSTSFGPGHAQTAQTTRGYDETSLQPSYITQHHATPTTPRANLTSTSKWLNTSTTPVISNTTWYDSGEVYQSKDPLGHTATTYFDSTGAYPNQVCNALNQCSYPVHDFNTGLMTSFTDMNGVQAGDPTHTTTYTYDTMLRPLCTNLPDGGQTCLSYPDANHASRQQKITPALGDSSTTVFDGLGRVSQTQHTLPACISKVDTTYDPVGAPFTVSNPYCTTADPTYGITQSFHDALGRGIKTIRQDGSLSSAAYSARNSGTANGTCVTATDEAGKQRMACHNGFGELMEVDEPSGAPIQANYHALMQQDGNFALLNSAGNSMWATGTSATNAASIFMQDDGNLVTYIFKWQAGIYAAASPGPFPSSSCSIGTYLVAGQILPSGKCIVSPHGQYFLLMNTDGNFFIYDWAHGTGTWGPGTQGHPGAYAIFQTDGNLVVYDVNGTALWNSGTSGTNAERLDMNDDGRIIIWKSAWNSGTSNGQFNGTTYAHPGCDVGIGTGTTGLLWSGQCFVSPNGRFELLLQADGNLVIYDRSVTPNAAIWSTGTTVSPVDPAVALRTLYSYDALGNLYCVEQHGDAATGTACPVTPPGPTDAPVQPDPNNAWRRRLFAYDSLSRLRWASNPEAGVITYAYDADGELLQKTSPAPNQTGSATQTVSYCHDELHRVKGKGYGAQSCPLATPVVSYVYDSGANAKGHLTSLTDQAGTASYTYDTLGRLATETRTLTGANNGAISKTVSYDYNLDGSLYKLHYPSGNVITYTPWNNGNVAASIPMEAKDQGSGINYVTGATYGPDGSLAGFISGSGGLAAITNTFLYNNRLQVCRMAASSTGAVPTSCMNSWGNVLDLSYDFHWGNGDNGNVFGITNYKDQNRNQTFTYDALNRLTSAQNAGTNCAAMVLQNKTEYWGNSYGYDAWGNLLQKSITKCGAENLSVTADAHNWLHASGTDYQYDAAGNMTYDATAALSYTFDQENRLTGAAGYTYTYDAEGNRVRKSNGNLAANGTLYWYMNAGIVAETDLAGTAKSEYVFFGGRRIARRDGPAGTGGVFYYFSDHLKTASVITDSAGVIKAESDYYPWGGELQFVNNDSNDYKFTGKKRDTETGLDYFGARYYSNGLGRWVSADWSPTPVPVPYADLTDPQTLNLYGYVRGLPTTKADFDGHGFWRKLTNWSKDDGCFCEDAENKKHKEEVRHQKAEEARKFISGVKQITINDMTPAEFAKSLNDQQAIRAEQGLSMLIMQIALDSPCGYHGPNFSCGIVFPVDFKTPETLNWSADFKSEGEARAFARAKLGNDPVEVEPFKLRSRDGRWQYRAKPGDFGDGHIHLEELDPITGEVKQNLHLRWKPGTER